MHSECEPPLPFQQQEKGCLKLQNKLKINKKHPQLPLIPILQSRIMQINLFHSLAAIAFACASNVSSGAVAIVDYGTSQYGTSPDYNAYTEAGSAPVSLRDTDRTLVTTGLRASDSYLWSGTVNGNQNFYRFLQLPGSFSRCCLVGRLFLQSERHALNLQPLRVKSRGTVHHGAGTRKKRCAPGHHRER